MKKLYVLTILLGSLMLTACGGSKKAAGTQLPGRTLRTTEPCIELALADSENLRAYGTATSYIEKTALNEAERDARNRLATMIKVAVEGAAQDYEQNAAQNQGKSAETIGESVMSQFVAEEIKNTKILKTSIYDLADGSIQVYVCIEMQAGMDAFEERLKNTLDREEIIGIQYDRDRFIEKMAQGLEQYKQRQKQEE